MSALRGGGILLAKAHNAWLTAESLAMVEEMVVTGAWWDFVDAIATKAFGAMLRAERATMDPVSARLGQDANIWKRRTAILAQLKFKKATDEALLRAVIEPSLDDRGFFLARPSAGRCVNTARPTPHS